MTKHELLNRGGVVWVRSPMNIAAVTDTRRNRVILITNGFFGIGKPFSWTPGQPMPPVNSWVHYVREVSADIASKVRFARIIIRPPSGLADIRTTMIIQLEEGVDVALASQVAITAVTNIVGQSPLHAHETERRRRRPAPIVVSAARRATLPSWARFHWGLTYQPWRSETTGNTRIPLPA